MEQFFIIGSGIAVGAAAAFLGIAIAAALKIGKANAIHTYIFFAVSMLLLALFLLEWRFAFGRVNQEVAATGAATSQNLSPLWLSAIGTTLLAMMTFIVSILLPWWKRPKFKVEFDNKEPYCRPLPSGPIDFIVMGRNERGEAVPFVQTFPSAESYWLRAKVTNSGKSVAKRCTGRLVQFIGKSGPVETHDLVNLHWINTPWSSQEFFPSIDLNQGEHDFLDVLVTRPDHKRKELLFMSPQNLFSDNHDMVPEGTCRIQVTVYGDNVKPCTKEYSIIWEDSNYMSVRLKEIN